MTARIYKPARTAMQSGAAKTKDWVLDYEPEEPRVVEPLMGWTSSGDTSSSCGYVSRPRKRPWLIASGTASPIRYRSRSEPARRTMAYADNFAFTRKDGWTH